MSGNINRKNHFIRKRVGRFSKANDRDLAEPVASGQSVCLSAESCAYVQQYEKINNGNQITVSHLIYAQLPSADVDAENKAYKNLISVKHQGTTLNLVHSFL